MVPVGPLSITTGPTPGALCWPHGPLHVLLTGLCTCCSCCGEDSSGGSQMSSRENVLIPGFTVAPLKLQECPQTHLGWIPVLSLRTRSPAALRAPVVGACLSYLSLCFLPLEGLMCRSLMFHSTQQILAQSMNKMERGHTRGLYNLSSDAGCLGELEGQWGEGSCCPGVAWSGLMKALYILSCPRGGFLPWGSRLGSSLWRVVCPRVTSLYL